MAKDSIPKYFIENWNIEEDENFDVEYVDAKQFLTAQRIDLVCKLIYIDSKVKSQNKEFAKELYIEHLRAFSMGTFIEPSNPEKNSIEKYLAEFDYLIDTCQSGLTHLKSVVPVGEDGNILDGAHRTAIAIFFNIRLPIIRIPNITVNYDYRHFMFYGLKQVYLDYISYNFLLWKDKVYIACLWPVANTKEGISHVETIIAEKANIYYKKEVALTYQGICNIMAHTYGHQRWSGNALNGFSGIPPKAKACYKRYSSSVFYILYDADLEIIKDIKTAVRDYFQLSNHSIHITDTKEEALFLGKEILNDNSIDLINYGYPFKYTSFVKNFFLFRSAIDDSDLNFDDCVLDSSSVLALYGIRDNCMIQYCTNVESGIIDTNAYKKCSESFFIQNHDLSIDSLIYNPKNYLFFWGIKFISLDLSYALLKRKNKPKRVQDIKLIELFMKKRNCQMHSKSILSRVKKILRQFVLKSKF